MIKKYVILVACVATALSATCQQATSPIKESFDKYERNVLEEKIYAHTDKSNYMAGEILWCKLYVVNGIDNRPIGISKVAYLEILDKDQKPVIQSKIELTDGTGNGSVYLPVTLNTGPYTLRVYTNWMKNYSADSYFQKQFIVINSLKNIKNQSRSTTGYAVQFFPEGGSLVQGLKSRVAFKVSDQSGKGVDCSGIILDNNNDTVGTFSSLKFGIGRFDLLPLAGNAYKALVKCADTVLIRELPKALLQGYVLNVNEATDSQLHVRVTTNIPTSGVVHLFIYTGQQSKLDLNGIVSGGLTEFIINKKSLSEGVSHITVFNSESIPVCERLYFIQPTHKLVIQATSDAQQIGPRGKMKINIKSTDEAGYLLPANMSMSVYKIDSLQEIENDAIDNYFWLTSELKGNIESPGYYFSEVGTVASEAIDNLMLTHGWRKFSWQDVMQQARTTYHYLPEYKGHIIQVKVTNKRTAALESGVFVYLSVPGLRVQLHAARSDSSGIVRFYMKEFYGPNEIVLQTDERRDTIYKLEIMNPFSDKIATTAATGFDLQPYLKNLVTDYSVSTQVQNNYSGDKLRQEYLPVVDSSAFYGKPDNQYMLDDYTRFSTMEEVLREYVAEVLVRRQKENFRLIMSDDVNRFLLDDPLTLFNGVPVFDPNRIIKYDPLKVKKIETIKRRYFYGSLIFNGIVNFITYQPDPSMVSTFNPFIYDYEGMQYKREFYSPIYDSPAQVSSRIPDFRNVLYWSPDVHTDARGKTETRFFTSDIKGRYVVVLQGMNSGGNVGARSFSFDVK